MTSAAARRSTWARSESGPERFLAVKESITRAVETAYRWRAWLAMSRRTSVLGTVLARRILRRLVARARDQPGHRQRPDPRRAHIHTDPEGRDHQGQHPARAASAATEVTAVGQACDLSWSGGRDLRQSLAPSQSMSVLTIAIAIAGSSLRPVPRGKVIGLRREVAQHAANRKRGDRCQPGHWPLSG